MIGRKGIISTVQIPLNELEQDRMNHSANTLRDIINESFANLEE